MTLFAKYSLAQILSLTFRGQMGCTPKYLITYFIVEPISGEEQKPINSVESEQCRWQVYFPSNPFLLFNMLLWICLRQICTMAIMTEMSAKMDMKTANGFKDLTKVRS